MEVREVLSWIKCSSVGNQELENFALLFWQVDRGLQEAFGGIKREECDD